MTDNKQTTTDNTEQVKPFYIRKTNDITDEMVAGVFDKCVAKGVELKESVKGFDEGIEYTAHPRLFELFGVCDNATYFEDNIEDFGTDAVELTINQVDEHLNGSGNSTTEVPDDNNNAEDKLIWTKPPQSTINLQNAIDQLTQLSTDNNIDITITSGKVSVYWDERLFEIEDALQLEKLITLIKTITEMES